MPGTQCRHHDGHQVVGAEAGEEGEETPMGAEDQPGPSIVVFLLHPHAPFASPRLCRPEHPANPGALVP
jgi:hypothetical protein